MASKYRALIASKSRYLLKSSGGSVNDGLGGCGGEEVPSVRALISRMSLTFNGKAGPGFGSSLSPFAIRIPTSAVFPSRAASRNAENNNNNTKRKELGKMDGLNFNGSQELRVILPLKLKISVRKL